MTKPNCLQCRHYYITWKPQTPNGCRRYGIQCAGTPSAIIASAGAGDCKGFEAKKKAEAELKGLDLGRKDLW